ncbi:1025_t:CDS:2 [Ambispora leptoticha]|uniref:1025_t:CDS:1 n=1 Tax=Ambispora leptoticha TaxID=144679 RepID=A0A9N8YWJ7_9GLOM|nr:1025_t:CDS:2 [Ambispora leptoticha]
MNSQQTELGQDSYSTNGTGGSPQHEARYFSSKRAREIQAEEGITSPYRSAALPPPSLSTSGAFTNGTLLSDSNPAPSIEYLKSVSNKSVSNSNGTSNNDHLTQYPHSFRRARADTLPSNLSGGRSPFSIGHHTTSSLSSLANQAPSNLLSPPKASSRLRSGSLTLPSSSLSAAFGPSIFTTGWSDHRNENNGPPTPSMPTPTTGELLRGDENNTVSKTLDYLGLDDHEHGSMGSGVLSKHAGNSKLPQIKVEMKQSNSPSYSQSGPTISAIPALRRDANRIRSYSVSATAKYDDQPTSNASIAANTLFPPGNAAVQQFHQTHSRPRAISLGILDLPNEVMVLRGRNGQIYTEMPETQQSINNGGGVPRSLGGEQLLGMMVSGMMEGKKKQQQQIHVEEEYLMDHGDLESTPPPQTPTRSLWIGNIDPSLTTQDLMQLFSPFGIIESLRLLPDKECGFVNFARVEDAVRAKDDIMNRMGGRVGNCIVRVGYGKSDALNSHDISLSSQTQSQPTRALWVGNIPTSTTPQALQNIFSPYGTIESARVLTHKNCGFVNFEKLDDAIKAKKSLHGKEVLGSAVGPVKIGYAKVQPKPSPSSTPEPGSPTTLHERNQSSSSSNNNDGNNATDNNNDENNDDAHLQNQTHGQWNGQVENYHSNMMMMLMANASSGLTEKQLMMRELSGGLDDDIDDVNDNRPPTNYFTSIPPVRDPNPNRKPDASRLREIRKRLDSGHCLAKEVEALASEVLEECVELSSDYIGNTVIQKLFERCSDSTKMKMLEKIAPHMATIGIHKNGTWAAQKIIDCVKTPAQMNIITAKVKPYTPPLLLDQFGNYVVQCCLRLGTQRNQFIFDAMVDRCLEVAQGRFGARAMRACLESQYVSKKQQKQVAIAIVMNAVPLSTNPNGALLLTWLLDTSSFPGRYRILAPKLANHLGHLCTHKLASLTVLKIINQRQEPDARDITISSLFFSANDQVLEDVLNDQVHGVGVVQKVLGSPYIDPLEKQRLVEKVRIVLGKLKVQQVQGYKRLLEELGMIGDPSINGVHLGALSPPLGIPPQGLYPENANSSPLDQLSPTAILSPSNENASTTTSSAQISNSTPTGNYPPPTPMFMNNIPMSHPHSPFSQASPYPHMSHFPTFIHPTALAAVAAGMYGHPAAMFNPNAYPYMLASGGAIPPPILNTGPPTPSSINNPQMLAFFQQPLSSQHPQQQSLQQEQQPLQTSNGSDSQAQSSPPLVIDSLEESSTNNGNMKIEEQEQ